MRVLVTGCAGFIGSHVCEFLLERGNDILGIDNLNNYYSIKQKYANLNILNKYKNFIFYNQDIRTTNCIKLWKPDKIIHLASMAGVRYSIENPKLYVDININGFVHILEESRKNNVKHIIYASSSSVYGLNKKVPFRETDKIDTCNSPYACSKMAMELYAKTYHQLYNLSIIGLRLFTVYGPRGRPDMAPYKFINAIMNNNVFLKYGDGSSARDYTYITDIVLGIVSSLDINNIKYGIYNLGNSTHITLNQFINTCEKVVNKKASYIQIKNQLGDVPFTFADISKAKNDLNYNPNTELEDGLKKTYEWMLKYS